MISEATVNYWLDIFKAWIETRDMPGPQTDEALAVVKQLRKSSKLAADIEAGVIVIEMPADDSE